MTSVPSSHDTGPLRKRLDHFARQAGSLDPEVHDLVEKILEDYSVSIEELQVAAQELQHQNQELLASREEIENGHRRYRELFEFAPDGYLVTDPVGIIQEANQAVSSLLNVPKVELLGKPLVVYVASDERDRFHRQLDRIAGEQPDPSKSREWELNIRPRNSPEFPAALTLSAVRDGEGQLTGLRWLLRDISASKRAAAREHLLKESNQQRLIAEKANRLLQALIETMPVGAVISDAQGHSLTTNSAARQILGSGVSGSLTAPERTHTPYRPDGTPMHPEDMPLMLALKKGRRIQDVEILIQRADGAERTILSHAAPVKNESGEIISGIVVFQDITEQKEARETLQRYSERLRILHQADKVILSAASAREIVAKVLPFVSDLVPCERASVLTFDWEKSQAIVQGVLSNGVFQKVEDLRLPLDEDWSLEKLVQIEFNLTENLTDLPISPFLREELQANGMHTFLSVPLVVSDDLLGVLNLAPNDPDNLTARHADVIRKLADQLAIGLHQIQLRQTLKRYTNELEERVAWRTASLRASEARFRTVFEDSIFGIALLDENAKVIECNPALARISGYDEDELREMVVFDPALFAESEIIQETFQALVKGELSHYQQEVSFFHKQGQERWWQLTISRVKSNRDVQPRLLILMAQDITEMKANQEALIRSERLALAGQLGASLAHEINNPLQSVIGCLGLADEMLAEEDQVRTYFEMAMEELERAAEIVTQLRDLSRTPALAAKQPVDLNALVDKVLFLTQKKCQNSGVEVVWDPAEKLPLIPLVAERIQQVCLNIIFNAVAAMPEGGQLHVSTHLTGSPSGIRLTFSDTGTGIEPEHLDRIFEPFHSTRSEGLGLGLYISKKIVEQHDGWIKVENQPGNGAIFHIWLPLLSETSV